MTITAQDKHMNCGFCCTRHPIERMGEHGYGICGITEDEVKYGAQWLLKLWSILVEDEAAWQDKIEGVAESLFPHQYGEVMARDGDLTEQDQDTMMRAESKAENLLITEFIARLCFLNGITTDEIAARMEENE